MVFLGVTRRVTYVSPTYRHGLQGVYVLFERPDGEFDGPFPMTESNAPYGTGYYHYDYTLSPALDPEGRYLAMMFSPQENKRTESGLEFCRRPVNELDVQMPAITELVIQLPPATLTEVEILSSPADVVSNAAAMNVTVNQLSGADQALDVETPGVAVLQAIDEPGTTIEVST